MAHTANGSTDFLRYATITGPTTAWSFIMHIRNAAAPGTAVVDIPVNIGSATTDQHGFAWDHTNSTFMQAVYQRRNAGTYDVSALTSTLSADTYYAIGGRWDGTNISAWLNGAKEDDTLSAAPSAATANINIWQDFAATSRDDSTIAYYALWSVALSDADMQAVGKGFNPLMVRPASLLIVADLTRNGRALKGSFTITNSGPSTIVANPRIIMPMRVAA